MHDEFSKIEEAIHALKEGRIIIVVDDEDRENEGDFVAAAETITPEKMAFIIRGGGQLCMPILPEVASRLQLGPMVDRNTTPHQTQYTVPVDHVSSHTGISPAERRGPSGRSSIRRASRAISSARGMFSRSSPRREACSVVPDTPKRQWTWSVSPARLRQA